MQISDQELVLYHVLNDDDCAEVRRYIVRHNLSERIQFRNIDRSESASHDLQALQGSTAVPTLVAGSQVFHGKRAILEFLIHLGRVS